MCFARSSFARAGTAEARYNGKLRQFIPLDEHDAYAFRVLPARYAAYVAMQQTGERNSFGPKRFQSGDEGRRFWIPIHKLFSGSECIKGYDLKLTFSAHYINEKLRRFHQFMSTRSHDSGWKEPDTNNFPFVIRDD